MSLSTLGRIFFAVSMVAFGIRQLVTAEFVRLVPSLPAWMPWHPFWPRLVGILLILAGAAIATGRKARWAAAVLGALLILSILFLHLPKAATDPLSGFMWTNPCKALAMLGAALILAGALPEEAMDRSSALARLFRRSMPLGPLFLGAFLILGGIQHFVYLKFVMTLVPSWIPGAQFWVWLTGTALIAGGVGLLVPKTARLAATMVGIMILLWVILLHVPRAVAHPRDPGETSGVFEALALSGAAFILADRGGRRNGRRLAGSMAW
ncbi:MAG TPA: DoxX family membrane protein [Thermoanaerobaculia bacterium]|jgi:uncharacterized membrane protein YphA (DoxX/SURF4 family)